MSCGLVSVVVVNWNGLEHLKKCLPSLYKQKYKKIQVILVDNGSVDGSNEWVQKHYPKIDIIVNDRNVGFAQANNQGFSISKGEYVLFLNNDTKVREDFLIELLKPFKRDSLIGGVQGRILFMDDPKRLDSIGSFLTYTGFLYHYGIYAIDSPKFRRPIKIFSAKGACMIFRKKVLDEVFVDGVFDKRYFAYFEETDLCHRVWLAGYKIVYQPTSVILHKYGATSQKLLKPFVEYHSYKNRICSYIKNLSLFKLIQVLFVHLMICFGLSIVFLLKGKLEITWVIYKAVFWNIVNIKKTLRIRKIVQQRIRRVSDSVIFNNIVASPSIGYYLSLLKGWNTTQIDFKNEI